MYIFSDIDSDLREIDWLTHKQGYGYRKKKMAHRVVVERMIGRPLKKGELADHINRQKHDNRRENLRLADKSLNSINRDKRPDNTTGYVGVYLYHPKQWQEKGWAKRWSARVERYGKVKYLGYYKTPELAYKAREEYLATIGT